MPLPALDRSLTNGFEYWSLSGSLSIWSKVVRSFLLVSLHHVITFTLSDTLSVSDKALAKISSGALGDSYKLSAKIDVHITVVRDQVRAILRGLVQLSMIICRSISDRLFRRC